MRSMLILGLLASFLTGCATQSKPLPPTLLPASLTEPCAPFPLPALKTHADLARAYIGALEWGQECRDRHKALGDAVRGQP